MILKSIGILLAVSTAVAAKNLQSRILLSDSGDYYQNTERLFSALGQNEEPGNKREYNVCQTDACKILGRELKSSMNTSVNPCENFYDFVCGAWNDRTDIIPPYEDSWGRVELLQHTVYKRIRDILEVELEPSDILPVRQAKIWYRACMNTAERENRGVDPIESILTQTGGWPIIMDPEEWSEDDFSWQDLEKNYFYITGELAFYDIGSSWNTDDNGVTTQILISDSSLVLKEKLPDRFKSTAGEKEWDTYKSLVKRVAKEFVMHNKAPITDEKIQNDVDALVKFEKKLYAIGHITDESIEVTVGEFLRQYNQNVTALSADSKIDFEQLFKIVFGMINFDIDNDREILVLNTGFYVRLSKLLSETSKRTIANYIHWKFVSVAMFYTTQQMQTIWNEEVVKDSDDKQPPPSWLACVKDFKLEHAASYVFATKYFTERVEKSASRMVENIRRELASQIERSNWLNERGKTILLDKLNNIRMFIGFPDWYKNETAVEDCYKELKVGYDYFENMLNFNKYKIREKLLRMKTNSTEIPWKLDPTVANAFYIAEHNQMNIPAAGFQPPLFTPDLPDAVNYGTIGCIIGHEIGHAYDDTGIKFDKDGNDTELSNQMVENYYIRAECFLHQFNNYSGVTEPTYEGTTPPPRKGSVGRRTRGENIADTTGLQSVFKAWQKMNSNKNVKEDKLPGFEEFTDEQMFFISFAATWCSVQRPAHLEKMMKDVHSLPHLRVIGAASNTKEFARVFNCPKGSPMNPENKCNIWNAGGETDGISSGRRYSDHKRSRRSRWALNGW